MTNYKEIPKEIVSRENSLIDVGFKKVIREFNEELFVKFKSFVLYCGIKINMIQ